MTERGADPWHGWGAGGRPLDERVAAVVAPAPVVFQGAMMADLNTVERKILKMARDAQAAGWHVVATEALAGVTEVRRVALGALPQEDGKVKAGVRMTEDVLTPVVVASVALRMSRGGARAYGVWRDGRYASGGVMDDLGARTMGLRALSAYLVQPLSDT